MKRRLHKFLSLFLPFIASSCCSEHDCCGRQEYQGDCCWDSGDCCCEGNRIAASPWSFAPKARCNRQMVCIDQIGCGDQSQLVFKEPAANQVAVKEPVVTTSVLGGQGGQGGQKEEKAVEPVAFDLTLDLKENPTKYLHFIATLDDEGFLTLIIKNKGSIPLQEVTLRVGAPSLPHLLKEKVLVKFDGSVAEGASLTAQTEIGPFTNFDELKDSLQVNFVGAIPSVTANPNE